MGKRKEYHVYYHGVGNSKPSAGANFLGSLLSAIFTPAPNMEAEREYLRTVRPELFKDQPRRSTMPRGQKRMIDAINGHYGPQAMANALVGIAPPEDDDYTATLRAEKAAVAQRVHDLKLQEQLRGDIEMLQKIEAELAGKLTQ